MNLQRSTPYKDLASFAGAAAARGYGQLCFAVFAQQHSAALWPAHCRIFYLVGRLEYTRRISRSMPCYVIPASRVVHAMQNATVVEIATDTPDRLPRYRYFYRNDVRFTGGRGCVAGCGRSPKMPGTAFRCCATALKM